MSIKKAIISLLPWILFFNMSCHKEEERCGAYACENGGRCVELQCQCTIGYTGTYCELEKTPSSMQIQSIKVTNFPEWETSGSVFNSDPKPDIYVVISYNNSIIYTHPNNYSESERNTDYVFHPASSIVLLNPKGTYFLSLYDKDDDADDLVAEKTFTPYQEGLGFPEVIKVDNPGGLSFELTVQYSF